MMSKLESYMPRLALVLHSVKCVSIDPDCDGLLDVHVSTIEAAIEMVEWFYREADRLYGFFTESPEISQQRKLVQWIASKGGRVNGRDVQRGLQLKSEEAQKALKGLVDVGFGYWEKSESGQRGQPTRYFVLRHEFCIGSVDS